jgi:environmental stress-induced protein Ves
VLSFLPASARTPAPWKNGLGVTTEIACQPPGSDLESFHWRISIATIHADGAFSHFAGVDRHLSLLDGKVELTVDQASAVILKPDSAPISFPGDVPVCAALRSAQATDLNVMVRRSHVRARLRRLTVTGPMTLTAAETTMVVSRGPTVSVRCGEAFHRLSVDDAVLVRAQAGDDIQIASDGTATVYAVELVAVG